MAAVPDRLREALADHYAIERELGAGGMATVYLAEDDEGREFPFSALPALEAVLKEQRQWTDALEKKLGYKIPWVFHREGNQIKVFRRAWVTACKRALLVGMIPHDLRRTAVRNLERAGVSRSAAMKLTGHRTESVYRRYAIVSESDLREGAAKLAALHGDPPAQDAPPRHINAHQRVFED